MAKQVEFFLPFGCKVKWSGLASIRLSINVCTMESQQLYNFYTARARRVVACSPSVLLLHAYHAEEDIL
jgi:hypothetical protein